MSENNRRVYVIGHKRMWDMQSYTRHQKPDYESFARYYKIGVASNVQQRLSTLGSGTPHKLELITTIDSSDPQGLESALHSLFVWSNVTGEWFKLCSNALNSLKAFDRVEPSEVRTVNEQRRHGRSKDRHVSIYVEIMRVRESNGGTNNIEQPR